MSHIRFTHFITHHTFSSHTSLRVVRTLHTVHYVPHICFTHFITCHTHFIHFITCYTNTSHTSLRVTHALHTLHYVLQYTLHTSLHVTHTLHAIHYMSHTLHTLHYVSHIHFTHFIAFNIINFITCHTYTSHTSFYVADALHTLHYMSQIHFTHFIICRRCTSHTSLHVTDTLYTLHYMSQMHFTHFITCQFTLFYYNETHFDIHIYLKNIYFSAVFFLFSSCFRQNRNILHFQENCTYSTSFIQSFYQTDETLMGIITFQLCFMALCHNTSVSIFITTSSTALTIILGFELDCHISSDFI
jgi:hypothetical protein